MGEAASVDSVGEEPFGDGWIKLSRDLGRLLLFVLHHLQYLATRPEQLSRFSEQPGILRQVGDEFLHVLAFDFETQRPDG